MLKKISRNKPMIVIWAIFTVFAIINGICVIPSGDDFWWYYNIDFKSIFNSYSENGRYFTNILTYFMVRIPIVRVAVISVFMVAIAAVMYKLVNKSGKKFAASATAIFMIITIPNSIASQTINWISGFTNYVIGTFFSLIYLFFCFPLFDGKYDAIKKRWAFFTVILGFLGALCVENVTIFNAMLSIFVIVFSLVKYKKVNLAHIVYFIATAAASALMLMNNAYSSVFFDDNDKYGTRFVEFSGPDMMLKVYQELLPCFSRMFCILHILIAASILFLYSKKFRNTESKKRPKYAKLFLPVIVAYSAYSLYVANVGELVTMTPSYRIFAVELAFTFLYLVGLAYMFFSIGSTSDFIKRAIYICGTVIVTTPFVVVNPVNGRCFFMTFIFWSLIAADCVVSVAACMNLKNKAVEISAALFVGFFCIIISGNAICNKYIDNLRINYIKEQMEKDKGVIFVIKLPYTNNYMDFIYEEFSQYDSTDPEDHNERDILYEKGVCSYYGIDESFIYKKIVWLSTIEYFT